MSLNERAYSALVVSGANDFNTAMASMLPKANFQPAVYVKSVTEAQRAFAEREYDAVIINAPLKDDLGLRFAIDCSTSKKAVVLFLIQNEYHPEVCAKVENYGVFTLPKPMSKQAMETALRWLFTAKVRFAKTEKISNKMEDKMEEIRLVNKAKWLLISNEGLLEPEAHRYLEKEAMDRCISKKEIAKEIIDKYE